ncbi:MULTISPECIES: hypothetical protein [Planktothricoides]|uniref:Uncharacterized protein n=1 Tax=Planktothricoides raciborskii FACHB-1370 TaxID=2949576 RepID=A0ABR8EDE2_9CYAN|nr:MULTISPECIES: hypothetical protein [Planktothricoides]MBD2544656.1 hypothetical protein [Planktothricoides raciborskii FACHB-1370]
MTFGRKNICLPCFKELIGYLLFDDFVAFDAGNLRLNLIKIFFFPWIYILKTLIYGDDNKKIILRRN